MLAEDLSHILKTNLDIGVISNRLQLNLPSPSRQCIARGNLSPPQRNNLGWITIPLSAAPVRFATYLWQQRETGMCFVDQCLPDTESLSTTPRRSRARSLRSDHSE